MISVALKALQKARPTATLLRRAPNLVACGGSILVVSYHSSRRTLADSSRDEDCPLCRKFGQGPCKDSFYAWYNCTEKASLEGRGEDEIVMLCAEPFEAFRTCLDRQSEFYDSQLPVDNMPGDDLVQDSRDPSQDSADPGLYPQSGDVQDEWHNLICNELSNERREPFPDELRPTFETLSDGSLSISFQTDNLVLVFVEAISPEGKKELVAATALADLAGECIQIPKHKASKSLVVSGLYEIDADNLVILEHKM